MRVFILAGLIFVFLAGCSKNENTVTQSGQVTNLSITPDNRNVGSGAGSTTFTISSNVSWSASDNASWFSLSPTGGGSGITTLTATFSTNSNASQRVATITVTGGGSTVTATVTQPEPELNARYRLTFNATWSVQTHPNEFPSSAHFSGLIGMTHNSNVMLFSKGELASEGIKNMAETGGKSPLDTEIQNFISVGTGNILISGDGINSSPGEVSLEFDIASTHSMVSVVSMVAPSPDWFIAVSNINLIENDKWVTSKTITVDIYDAGTDDGSTFLSPDFPTVPPLPIDNITTPPLAVNNIVAPLGSITFTKIE